MGRTVSYMEIARRIGAPKAVRAVAGACAANNLASQSHVTGSSGRTGRFLVMPGAWSASAGCSIGKHRKAGLALRSGALETPSEIIRHDDPSTKRGNRWPWFTSLWGDQCDLDIIDELAMPDVLCSTQCTRRRRTRQVREGLYDGLPAGFSDLGF